MARIVSGEEQPQALTNFMLAHDFFAGQRRADEENYRRNVGQAAQLQRVMAAMQLQRAKSKQILNQQASMGDVQALQQLALEAHKPKHQSRAEEALKILSHIPPGNKEARRLGVQAIHELYKEEDRQEQIESTTKMLADANESGLFQPEEIQGWAQRLQTKSASGESLDDIGTEIMARRQKIGEDATNAGENQQELTQAQAIVESLPRGSYERRAAEVVLNSALADQGALKGQGFGRKVLKEVQKAALGTQVAFNRRQEAEADRRASILSPEYKMEGLGGLTSGEMKKQLERTPSEPLAFGVFGENVGVGGPQIPAGELPGTHKTRKLGKRPQGSSASMDIESIAADAADPLDFMKRLQAAGLPLTVEAQEAFRRKRGGAASQ